MDPNKKLLAFEYLVSKLIEWYNDVSKGKDYKEVFTKITVLKLHFFVSAVKADEKDEGLLDIFDNFYAMPYGHVESDIYNNLDKLSKYEINSNGISEKTINITLNIDNNIAEKIDESINLLRSKNEQLVRYDSFDLVELSHNWYSWQLIYSIAKREKKGSMRIPKEIIKSEKKTYHLPNALI